VSVCTPRYCGFLDTKRCRIICHRRLTMSTAKAGRGNSLPARSAARHRSGIPVQVTLPPNRACCLPPQLRSSFAKHDSQRLSFAIRRSPGKRRLTNYSPAPAICASAATPPVRRFDDGRAGAVVRQRRRHYQKAAPHGYVHFGGRRSCSHSVWNGPSPGRSMRW